jgi:hypothetical protein
MRLCEEREFQIKEKREKQNKERKEKRKQKNEKIVNCTHRKSNPDR